MEVFGIIGMSLGATGFAFGMMAVTQVAALEKRLKEAGVLDRDIGTQP